MPTVSVMLVTRFQLASTALTVTVKAVPAVRAVGAPVLPLAVPGAAVSPGTNSCSLVKAAAFTVMAGGVLAGWVPTARRGGGAPRLSDGLRGSADTLGAPRW